MRYAALILAVTLAPTALFAARPAQPASPGIEATLASDFSIDAKTTIPGRTLSPGQYTISVIEHLTDRVILQVSDKSGKVQSTFLALNTKVLPANAGTGPILWGGTGAPALRGFTFPGAPPVEFVYPKAQAVAIAKNNTDKVLAIDPASDNLSITHDNLSTQDMQIVTLWTLKSSRVGPDVEPSIEAARYQVQPVSTTPPAAQSYVARATPPTPLAAPSPRTSSPKSVQAAPIDRKPAIAALPHTASNLPEILLAAVLALLGSVALRLRRIYFNVA